MDYSKNIKQLLLENDKNNCPDLNDYTVFINLNQASFLLGIHPEQTEFLIKRGYITDRRYMIGSDQPVFFRSDILKLDERVGR